MPSLNASWSRGLLDDAALVFFILLSRHRGRKLLLESLLCRAFHISCERSCCNSERHSHHLVMSHLHQRGGYRQHLVQALVETVSGPVPPSALLPILRAKETGPSATDLAMEVLETVAGREHDDGSGSGGAKLKRAVLGNRADWHSGT